MSVAHEELFSMSVAHSWQESWRSLSSVAATTSEGGEVPPSTPVLATTSDEGGGTVPRRSRDE